MSAAIAISPPETPFNFHLSQIPSPALQLVRAETAPEAPVAEEKTAIETIEATIRRAHGGEAQQRVLATILEISREMPENVNQLGPAMAEHLAGRFLRGLEMSGELYSMACSYEMKMEILKRKEFSQAMLVRSVGVAGIKTAKEKEMFAYSDQKYIESADRHVEAKMFRIFVEEKKDSFSKAHYLLRKIVDRDQVVSDMSQKADWFQTPTE